MQPPLRHATAADGREIALTPAAVFVALYVVVLCFSLPSPPLSNQIIILNIVPLQIQSMPA